MKQTQTTCSAATHRDRGSTLERKWCVLQVSMPVRTSGQDGKAPKPGTMQRVAETQGGLVRNKGSETDPIQIIQVHGTDQKIYAMGLGRWLNGQRYFLPSLTTWFFLSPETTWWKECLHLPTNFPLTSTQNKCKSKSFKILVHKASKWNGISVNPKTNWK